MRGFAELYAQQFKTTFAAMLQYRASLAIWLIGHVLEPLIFLVVWSTVSASGGGSVGGFTRADFAAYFILLMLVNHLTYTWIMYEYEYRVRHGSLSFALLRPVHPIHADVADNLTSKVVSLPGMLLVALLLGLIFRPQFHFLPWAVIAFVPALLFAFVVRFLVEWTLALGAFWTTRVSALNQMYFVALLFLSGQIAPISLLPPPIRIAASTSPSPRARTEFSSRQNRWLSRTCRLSRPRFASAPVCTHRKRARRRRKRGPTGASRAMCSRRQAIRVHRGGRAPSSTSWWRR